MKKLLLMFWLGFIVVVTAFTSNSWIDFTVDEQLTVKMPTQPKTVRKDTVEADGFEQHLKISSLSDESGYYRISRDDLHHESDNYLSPKGRKEWYSVSPLVEGALFKAKFLKRETFNIDEIEVVDRTYELPASEQNEHTIKYVRSLLVGKVGYEFWFIPKDGFTNPCLDQKKLFFNSIRLKH